MQEHKLLQKLKLTGPAGASIPVTIILSGTIIGAAAANSRDLIGELLALQVIIMGMLYGYNQGSRRPTLDESSERASLQISNGQSRTIAARVRFASGFLRRNWGAPFVVAFIILSTSAAFEVSMGLPSPANDSVTYALYALIVGIALQVVSLARYGESRVPSALGHGHYPESRGSVRRVPLQKILAVSAILLAISGGLVFAFSTSPASSATVPNLAGPISANGNLVGYWPCNENTSGIIQSVPDLSGNGNNGVAVASPAFGTGRSGGACNFASTEGQYVALSSGQKGFPRGDGARSFFAWIRTNNSKSTATIFSYGSDGGQQLVVLNLNQDGPYRLYFSSDFNDCGITNPSIEDNTWHVVGFTYSGNKNLIIYVDGVGSACELSSKLNTVLSGTANIGSTTNLGNPNYFDGQISGIRFYARALSSTEVLALYSSNE